MNVNKAYKIGSLFWNNDFLYNIPTLIYYVSLIITKQVRI